MQLAIPRAPRQVRLRQVPGAVGRIAVAALVASVLFAAIAAAAWWAGRTFSRERGFLSRAVEVEGTVARVGLPPKEAREDGVATLDVLYAYGDEQRSVTGVQTHALYAEGIGPGAKVVLLVDPSQPNRPREARYVARQRGLLWLLPAGIALGLGLAVALFAFELRRLYRREVNPLRQGALVWLTPDDALPDTKAEIVFSGSYFRDDVKHTVRARGRPGRSPVRNGEKVLAAVVPSQPTTARVVDEDLARTLGWMR